MELQPGMLGNAIKTARLEKHLSQEKLSEIIGVTPTHIKHIESEHRKPSFEALCRLVTTLNISLDDLFFPNRYRCEKSELCLKAERLLVECNDYQLKIVIAVLEAMIYPE